MEEFEFQLKKKNSVFGDILRSAVVIEVVGDEEEEGFDMEIVEMYTNTDFRDRVMNGTCPGDNFKNIDIIPKKEGLYIFDVKCNGGADFNGESTEYWFECELLNCRTFSVEPVKPMSVKEKQLAGKMLNIASAEFGNRGCNEVDDSFFQDWTLEERQNFVKEYHEFNGDPENYSPDFIHLPDFAIMSFLAHKLSTDVTDN